MSKSIKPVWVWLPGSESPKIAGTFEVKDNSGGKIGYFTYDPAYLKLGLAFSLDPIKLAFRLKNPEKQFTTRLKNGLFGVFRDVCPEGYGRDLLNHRYGKINGPMDDMDLLEKSMGDSVGAIEICDDIQQKITSFEPPSATQLSEALSSLSIERSSSHAVHNIYGIGTSMGGERPKLTIEKEGALWLAKLQDRGDDPHMPARESVAMILASACGINSAHVELERTENHHEALFVKRFDRIGLTGQRIPYMSAQTVLDLDIGVTKGEPSRSYLILANRAERIGVSDTDIHEIWKRMALNALVNNIDDHPKNHGFLRVDERWCLAPAFDIVPLLREQPEDGPILAMSVASDGGQQASVGQILEAAPYFGLEIMESAEWLINSATTVRDRWLPDMLKAGVSEEFCTKRQHQSFQFSSNIANKPELVIDAARAIANRPKRRSRQRY